MKFSYRLLKKMVSKLPTSEKTADLLTMHLFETEVADKNTLEVDVLPNRFSDAASHIGLARELRAIIGTPPSSPPPLKGEVVGVDIKQSPKVQIKISKCNRMTARYFEGIKIKPSPKWMRDILIDCGFQPVNNLVDITNFVTLETGQPLHAFDWNKVSGDTLTVRPAKRGEEVETLEGKRYELNANDLVLADAKNALDVAGIKGGKKAEILPDTVNILLTAGSFDGATIYQTSRKINLATDASVRFSHNISSALTEEGIDRASQLILELCGGRPGKLIDVYKNKPLKRVLKFDIDRFNRFAGLQLKEKQATDYLIELGFIKKGDFIEVPIIRTDIEIFADLAEEVMRLHGYNNLHSKAPLVSLSAPKDNDATIFNNSIRNILINLGLDEVYNYSFSSQGDIELENPISLSYTHLRPSLLPALIKNTEDNHRFYKRVAIFEIGKTFAPKERLKLGMAILSSSTDIPFLELKGITEQLLQRLGLVDFFMKESPSGNHELRIESDHHVVGILKHHHATKKHIALAEIDVEKLMELVVAERSYEAFAKYPSIMRDLSLLVPRKIRFAQILSLIENAAPKYMEDVDLIDFYQDDKLGDDNYAITLRLVFLSPDKTLADKEVSGEIKKIVVALSNQLGIEVR